MRYNFGIIGPGKIANRFAEALQTVDRANLYAVASRDAERGRQFAQKFGITKVYEHYEDMAKDSAIDVIYVATPHTFHFEHTMMCLKHKKAVLCEKPLTLSRQLAQQMIDAATQHKTFLMEAMWTRFIPAIVEVKRLLEGGEIGTVQFLQGDFCFAAPPNPENRVFNLSLGGGAQLDVGVYPLFLAICLLGKPVDVKALVQKAETGADATTSAILKFGNGAIAHILSSVVMDSPKEAVILGTKGSISIHSPWHKSQRLTIRKQDGTVTTKEIHFESNGLQFQALEVIRCMDEKRLESPGMPWSLSLAMAEVSDEILRQGLVVYPTKFS
jgi:predicted dehydrogenase